MWVSFGGSKVEVGRRAQVRLKEEGVVNADPIVTVASKTGLSSDALLEGYAGWCRRDELTVEGAPKGCTHRDAIV